PHAPMTTHPSPHANHKTHASDPAAPLALWNHNGETPKVREQLEALDDAMFAAIAGNADVLERARTLWQSAVATLPWELVEESREHYLRFAAEASQQADEAEVRDAAAAVVAIEVLEMLTR